MGDPRKIKKKYSTPIHPWQRARIEEEGVIIKDHGLKNKKEVWILESRLRRFKSQAKRLIATRTDQARHEEGLFLTKLKTLGLVDEKATISSVLDLGIKDVADRRLQTFICRKGLARTVRQARQFITHKHIMVNRRVVSSPSYIVRKAEEGLIGFNPGSGLTSQDHPERVPVTTRKREKKKKDGPGKKRRQKSSQRMPGGKVGKVEARE